MRAINAQLKLDTEKLWSFEFKANLLRYIARGEQQRYQQDRPEDKTGWLLDSLIGKPILPVLLYQLMALPMMNSFTIYEMLVKLIHRLFSSRRKLVTQIKEL